MSFYQSNSSVHQKYCYNKMISLKYLRLMNAQLGTITIITVNHHFQVMN